MTHEQFKKRWDRLSFWRKQWCRAKAEWEHCTLLAVLLEHGPPPSDAKCRKMLSGPQ